MPNFGDATQGPPAGLPIDVEPGLGGVLWVADQSSGESNPGIGQLCGGSFQDCPAVLLPGM